MTQNINFFEERQPGDINLVAEVERILLENCITKTTSTNGVFHGNPLIETAKTRRPIVQQYLLNRYWYFQLISREDKNSMEERLALIVGENFQDWLTLFRQKIVPFLIDNDLPTRL